MYMAAGNRYLAAWLEICTACMTPLLELLASVSTKVALQVLITRPWHSRQPSHCKPTRVAACFFDDDDDDDHHHHHHDDHHHHHVRGT
jgi:hypothetical protein